MERTIVSFKLDNAGDWTAILSCGHLQHTRHRPPFENRIWVLSQEGRNSKIGENLNCVRCDNFEIPQTFSKFKATPEFTESSVPESLKREHQTNSDTWGKIIVLNGKLQYFIPSKKLEFDLNPDMPGIIVPELPHFIKPVGTVRFYIEFYRCHE